MAACTGNGNIADISASLCYGRSTPYLRPTPADPIPKSASATELSFTLGKHPVGDNADTEEINMNTCHIIALNMAINANRYRTDHRLILFGAG